MVNYGITRSTVRPQDVEIRETTVFTATNIREISENIGEDNEFVGFEFILKGYGKDEYIASMNTQLTDTQLALVEVYELIGG